MLSALLQQLYHYATTYQMFEQTTDESLRAAFQQFGEIHNASIIKEPVSQNSR